MKVGTFSGTNSCGRPKPMFTTASRVVFVWFDSRISHSRTFVGVISL